MKTKILLWLTSLWTKHKRIVNEICLVLLIISMTFFIGKHSTRQEHELVVNNLIYARDSIKTYDIVINGLKNSVWEKNAIILSQEDAIKAGLLREELLKKLHIKDLIANAELQMMINKKDSLLKVLPNTVFKQLKTHLVYHIIMFSYHFNC